MAERPASGRSFTPGKMKMSTRISPGVSIYPYRRKIARLVTCD
jgi:hypothetical protein